MRSSSGKHTFEAGLLVGIVVGLSALTIHGRREDEPSAPHSPDHQDDALWESICTVESHHDPKAYCASEDSAGIAQIRPICVRDCNRIVGQNKWTLDDRWDVDKSREMFFAYTSHYLKHYKVGGSEARARIWNGGPTGWRKSSTEGYWRKVSRELKRREQ